MKYVVLALALTACAKVSSVTCDDGRTCPSGTVCDDKHTLCVTEEQTTVCSGKADASECSTKTVSGHCLDDVCLPSVCGDGVTEFAEMCDDHNTVEEEDPMAPMRCSADCTSTRTCGNGVIDAERDEQCDDGNRLDHDGCSSLCVTEEARWIHHTVAPPALWATASAYDSRRGRLVMFGGVIGNANRAAAQTYEWTGADWIVVDTAAPAPRYASAATYDSDRGEVVMFGGFDGTWDLQDTWTYDGREWRNHDVPGPIERYSPMLVHDPKRHVTVLFGGWNDFMHELDDTWEWDGTAWHPGALTGPKPPKREKAAAAYDPKAGVIVMTGGVDNFTSQVQADTWTYDGTWHEVTSGTQPTVSSATMAWDVVGQRLVLVGGTNQSNTELSTMWTFNGSTWTNQGAAPFGARASMAMANTGDHIVLFGGAKAIGGTGETFYNDTWFFGSTWSQLMTPTARISMSGVNDYSDARAILFGGGVGSTKFAETWELSSAGYKKIASGGPAPRSNAAMVWDDVRHEAVMYGGINSALNPLPDTQTGSFSGATWMWKPMMPPSTPPALTDAGLGFDGSRAILFGGSSTGSTPNLDTWAWDGANWSKLAMAAKRDGPAMGWDPIRKQLVMFGGQCDEPGSTAACNDTWTFDGSGWTQLDVMGFRPVRYENPHIAWNPARARLTLIGGSQYVAEAYEWTGTGWFPIPTTNNPGQANEAVEISSLDGGGVMIVGGFAYDANQQALPTDQWEIRYEATRLQERCDGKDADGDGLQGCADPDCWTVCAPLCPPGVTCDAAASPRCGDQTCQSPRESCRTCSTDCGTCVPVCGDDYCDPGETGCPGDCP